GLYNVLVFDSNGCNSGKSFEVVVDTIPFVDLGNDTSICTLDSITLRASDNMLGYAWNTTEVSQDITVFQAGAYAVTVTDSLGCVNVDSLVVSLDSLPAVSIGNDTTICRFDSILLDAGIGFVSHQWNFMATDTNRVMVSAPSSYYVVVTDSNFCSASSDT